LTIGGDGLIFIAEVRLLTEYINEGLKRAKYELIDDEEPFYGEIPEFKGVWATGRTLEECRENLKETLEEWIILSFNQSVLVESFFV
jgi:predicted RNase H-like HicB family nuclease